MGKTAKTHVVEEEAMGEVMEVVEGEATGGEGVEQEGSQEEDPVADGSTTSLNPTATKGKTL